MAPGSARRTCDGRGGGRRHRRPALRRPRQRRGQQDRERAARSSAVALTAIREAAAAGRRPARLAWSVTAPGQGGDDAGRRSARRCARPRRAWTATSGVSQRRASAPRPGATPVAAGQRGPRTRRSGRPPARATSRSSADPPHRAGDRRRAAAAPEQQHRQRSVRRAGVLPDLRYRGRPTGSRPAAHPSVYGSTPVHPASPGRRTRRRPGWPAAARRSSGSAQSAPVTQQPAGGRRRPGRAATTRGSGDARPVTQAAKPSQNVVPGAPGAAQARSGIAGGQGAGAVRARREQRRRGEAGQAEPLGAIQAAHAPDDRTPGRRLASGRQASTLRQGTDVRELGGSHGRHRVARGVATCPARRNHAGSVPPPRSGRGAVRPDPGRSAGPAVGHRRARGRRFDAHLGTVRGRGRRPTGRGPDHPHAHRRGRSLSVRQGRRRVRQHRRIAAGAAARLLPRVHGADARLRRPGARRLVAGGDGDVYWTDDHYETFRQVRR